MIQDHFFPTRGLIQMTEDEIKVTENDFHEPKQPIFPFATRKEMIFADLNVIFADLNVIFADLNVICADKKVICADLNVICAD